MSGHAVVSLRAAKREQADFIVTDFSGKILYRQTIDLQEGSNTIAMNNLSNLPQGNMIASIKTSGQTFSQQFFKQ